MGPPRFIGGGEIIAAIYARMSTEQPGVAEESRLRAGAIETTCALKQLVMPAFGRGRTSHLHPSPSGDLDGVTHTVQVQGSSLDEAAARALAASGEQGWAADGLTPNATLRVKVHALPVVHEVRMKAVERWLRSSNANPKEAMMKRAVAP
jgi:hypothetical protein